MSVKQDVLKYVDVKGLAMEYLYDEVVSAALDKIKEKIPGQLDDAVIDMLKPLIRAEAEKRVDAFLAKQMAS